MGKTLKIIVCGKKATGKTTILEQIVYNNYQQKTNDKYYPTIEDIYIACWEKDKGLKEKIRFYDTKGMENSKDTETINQMRHLFSLVDGACLVFSSNDSDSIQCVEKLKAEIEKSIYKKEICHFILIDNQTQTPVNQDNLISNDNLNISNKDSVRQELQSKLKAQCFELNSLDKRDSVCKPFIELAQQITQISTKGPMNITIKKPKVFSSSKQ